MLHFGVSASNYAPFLGSNILQRGDYAHHEICYFVVVHASPFPLQPVFIIYFSFPAYLLWPLLVGQYPFFFLFFSAFFFGIAQAFKRRFCSGICYFSLFLLPIMLRFWGSNMLQRGDYAREACYFVVVHASSFPLQPVCIIYFSFPAYLLWP